MPPTSWTGPRGDMLLSVENVTKIFGANRAVDKATFAVDRPCFIGIIGRSGAGKSTFLRMMNRLTDATEGRILFEGRDVLAPKRAEALSSGQQQRVAIARALMQDPKVILADEPISSLDPMNARIVMDTLRRIHDEDGRTVVANLRTHDTARRYCDRVIGMRAGRIVFDGLPSQLTTGVAREICGADASFSESATSTSI